jgi:hypothetical protein
MIRYFDSFETEQLRKLLTQKETYLNTLTAPERKIAYQMTQREIMFLKNDILPIVLNNTSIIHSEFIKYALKCFDAALKFKCNGLIFYQPIYEQYKDYPIIGVVNPRQNQKFGTHGAMEIFIDNMDGNGCRVKPLNLPIEL